MSLKPTRRRGLRFLSPWNKIFDLRREDTHHIDVIVAQGKNFQLAEIEQRSTLQSLAGQEVVVQQQSVEERQVSEGVLTKLWDVVATQTCRCEGLRILYYWCTQM